MAVEPLSAQRAPAVVPILFVVLWSTGWIVARYAAEYCDPITFLSIRYALAAVALLAIVLVRRSPWPRSPAQAGHAMVSGVLIHAIYLGAVYWAVSKGVPASISALLSAIQPILSVVLAPILLRETVRPRQALGVALGFLGLLIVVEPKLRGIGAPVVPLAINALAMLSVTLGTFYQKRFVRDGDLGCVVFLQYLGAIVVSVPFALLFERLRMTWNLTTTLAMTWSVLAISVGAVVLLMMLIRQGALSKQAQLFYLVPPAATLEAYVLFDERLSALQLAGMATTLIGVVLATRGR